MADSGSVIDWLLESDPSIRWQVMRDLLVAPEPEWGAERARVAAEGWGARLLACEDEDGQWAGGALSRVTSRPAMDQVGPAVDGHLVFAVAAPRVRAGSRFGPGPARRRLIGANSRWDDGGQPFWEGEVEECINGRTVADGAYFGVDVAPLAERLAGERIDDGGWNCERANGSVRTSFDTTINVLEGLLEYERATGGTPESRAARTSVRSISWSAASSAGLAPASRRTSSTFASRIRPDGTMTSCAPWATFGPPRS